MIVFAHAISASFFVAILAWVLHTAEGNSCRVLGFNPLLGGKRLLNHKIKTEQTHSEDSCQTLCYMNNNCHSINFKQTKENDGTHLCELNDSDKVQHPGDLKNEHAFTYRGTKSPCSSNPCQRNAACQTGFGPAGYRCICLAGFTGVTCEQDVDECDEATSPCQDNADCINTPGSYVCNCSSGYRSNGRQCKVMTSCQDLLSIGENEDGLYFIKPDNQGALKVYCDQTTDGGGWTVLQRRMSPFNTSFNRNWEEYRIGFGNLTGEFWLGNDNIHRLTSTPVSFRVDFRHRDQEWYARYERFTVAGAVDRYRWNMMRYSGSLPNSIYGSSISNVREEGMQFSSPDSDNDGCADCVCAGASGWWFNHCGLVNLNFVDGPRWAQSLIWPHHWMVASFDEMKVRP